MCDGVGLSLAEAANELALFNVDRVVYTRSPEEAGQGRGVSLGRGRRGKETADAVLLLYLPRREAAAGSDPEALDSASAEGPTRTWDTRNACVIGLLLFPAPAHQTGHDVPHL